MKGGQIDHPKTKSPSKSPALLGLNFSTGKCLWRIQELFYIYFNERLFCNLGPLFTLIEVLIIKKQSAVPKSACNVFVHDLTSPITANAEDRTIWEASGVAERS